MLSRCPLTEHDDFFSLWAEYQQHEARRPLGGEPCAKLMFWWDGAAHHTPARHAAPTHRPLSATDVRPLPHQSYVVPLDFQALSMMAFPPAAMPVPGVELAAPPRPTIHNGDDGGVAHNLEALDGAIVCASKRTSAPSVAAATMAACGVPRHLSSQDIATGGRARPPPPELRPAPGREAAPTLVVPIAPDLAMRLNSVALTPAPTPVPVPVPVAPLPLSMALQTAGRQHAAWPGTDVGYYYHFLGNGSGGDLMTALHCGGSDVTSEGSSYGGGMIPQRSEMCYLWRQLGMCNRANCRFAHDPQVTMPSGAVMPPPVQVLDLSRPVRVCAYHIPGSGHYSMCKKGSSCDFLHL